MAAHENQDERVILFIGKVLNKGHHTFAPPASGFAANLIDDPARCHLNEPCTRVFGNSFVRPLRGCQDEGLLYGIFGVGKIVKSADDRTEHPRSQFAQQVLERVRQIRQNRAGARSTPAALRSAYSSARH